jgi:hypothetical protein
MVSTFFTSPVGPAPTPLSVRTQLDAQKNGETVKAGQTFTLSLAVQGMKLGSFTNAKADYYAAPQQLIGGQV